MNAGLTIHGAGSGPFDFDQVIHFKIEIPPSGIDALRQSNFHRHRPDLSHRPKVKAQIRINDEPFKDVSVRLKGAAGSFRSIDSKPALTVNLDTHVKGQDFRGYDKFYLNNSVQDRSYCNEIICRELFQRAGIPTPRATHATVELNGRDLGLYVMIEGFNKKWLKRHFDTLGGNLYDSGFLKDIHADLTVNVGENPEDHTAKNQLIAAVYEKDLGKLLPGIAQHLDLDMFLTHVALDTLTWNWDGYAMKPNNYRLYHNLDTGKFQFIPHGMDQMFENPHGRIYPRFRGVTVISLMRLPAMRQQYFKRMRQLYGTVFQPKRLVNRVDQLAAVIEPELKKRSPHEWDRNQRGIRRLKDSILARGDFLGWELTAPDRALKFPESGFVQIKNWKTSRLRGDIQFRNANENNQQVLVIESGSGINIGRWYSQQLLTQGVYRFEARVKCENVVRAPNDRYGGVRVRASGSRLSDVLTGTRNWAPMTVEFLVTQPVEEVELSCEFRGMQGRVWFEEASLRLVKLR